MHQRFMFTDVLAWRLVGALFPVPWQRCSYWPVRAPERFQGPFNGTFANKVLLIGNAVCMRILRALLASQPSP